MLEYSSEDETITDVEIPDPEVLPRLPSYHLLLREIPISNKTKGGIILTDAVMDDVRFLNNCFRVVKLGDLAYADRDEAWVQEGDLVVTGKNVGKKINYKGIIYTIINDDQVVMVVDSPEDVDPVKTTLSQSATFRG